MPPLTEATPRGASASYGPGGRFGGWPRSRSSMLAGVCGWGAVESARPCREACHLAFFNSILVRTQRLLAGASPSALMYAFSDASVERSLAVAAGSITLFGLGGWLWWLESGLGDPRSVFMKSVLFGSLTSFALWLLWLLVVYAVLQRMTGHVVAMERLVREAGMATAPLAFGVLMGVLPSVAFGVGITAIGVWVMAMQVAVERATELRGWPVLVANAAGFAVWALTLSMLSTSGNSLAPGPFLAESVWEAVVAFAPTVVQ